MHTDMFTVLSPVGFSQDTPCRELHIVGNGPTCLASLGHTPTRRDTRLSLSQVN